METNAKIIVVVKSVILHAGKVLIVKRAADNQIGGGTWECAGGKLEFGEDLETALIREIKEETGLEVFVERILYAATSILDPLRQVVIINYLCKCTNTIVELSKEHSDYKWVTKEEAQLFLTPGIIHDFEKNNVFTIKEWL